MADRQVQTVTVPAGSTLLLYTDGLVETGDGDIDQDLGQLLEAVRQHKPSDGASALVERPLARHRPHGDDVAVLAVRLVNGS